MATAKKVAAKAAPKKKVQLTTPKKTVKQEQEFSMPMEVKDWIDQAMSRLKNLQSKVERLEAENKELKSYKRWAEHRILNSSPE
jgi:predicted transcriptional regulator